MRHYSNAWKFLLIFENLKLRLSELYHFAYAQQQVPSKYSKLSHVEKRDFSFPLGLVWSEIRVRQAVKPSDCLYFVSICPRGSVSRHIFCRAYELPLLCFYTQPWPIEFLILTHFPLILCLCL